MLLITMNASFVASRILGLLGHHYGADLSRQSDINLPRTTKFGKNILHTRTKKEGGHNFAGILLCILFNTGRGSEYYNQRVVGI